MFYLCLREEKMQDLVNAFEKFKRDIPEQVIIWGAGYWGIWTYEWFEAHGLDNRVVGFIDNNHKLHGTLLCNKEVFPKEYLSCNKNVCVIISLILWHEVYKEFADNFYENDLYIAIHNFLLLTPWLNNNSQFNYSIEEIKGVYESEDDYTTHMLLLHDMIRKDYKTLIVPIENALQNKSLVMSTTKPILYWESEEARLDRFDKFTLVDGGAYIGDSLQQILNSTKSKLAHAYCFELDKENAKELRKFISNEKLRNRVTVYDMGLGNTEKSVGIYKPSAPGTTIITDTNNGNSKIVSLDMLKLVVDGKLCIKLDIEGFELDALQGARDTIRAYKPELAVCVYHKNDDVYEIPKMIKSIAPEYKCVLRGSWHMVCTASIEW